MLRRLHRRIGINTLIFLSLFIITGLLLQHASWLNLGKRYVAAPLAETFYGVTVNATTDYKTRHHWVSQAGNFLYLDAVPVAGVELNNLQGAVESKSYIWATGGGRLLLLSKQGEMVDAFSVMEGLPGIVTQLGENEEGDIIAGGLYNNWQMDEDLLNWRIYDKTSITWSKNRELSQVSNPLRAAILSHARNHLITWERLLSDLHSGRLFGDIGVVVFDLVAVLLLFLSVTGSVLWIRGK